MSPETGNDARRWIVIIVAVIMGFSGLTFGIIGQASGQEVKHTQEYAEDNRVEIKVNRRGVQELRNKFGVLQNEIKHIRSGVDLLNEKLDKVLER